MAPACVRSEGMSMTDIDPVYIKLDQVINLSRLQEISLLLSSDRSQRIATMMSVLGQLPAGSYLLGTGPSTVGIIPLTVDEVVLGRAATPLEKPSDTVVDYAVTDTLYFSPCEVSRAHAKICRRANQGDAEYSLVDLSSTRGTFLNGKRVTPGDSGQLLSHGDVVSLGPSQMSTYVFFEVTADVSDS